MVIRGKREAMGATLEWCGREWVPVGFADKGLVRDFQKKATWRQAGPLRMAKREEDDKDLEEYDDDYEEEEEEEFDEFEEESEFDDDEEDEFDEFEEEEEEGEAE